MTTREQVVLGGAIAALSFLVLALGYRILTPARPSMLLLLVVAGVVGILGGLAGAMFQATFGPDVTKE